LEPMRGKLVDRVEIVDGAAGCFGFAAFGVGGRLFDLDARVIGEASGGFGEGEAFRLHDEVEDVALLLATEAVEKALLGVHAEARGLLLVEGAEPHQAPALTLQLHAFGDDRSDLQTVANRGDRFRRNHVARNIRAKTSESTPLVREAKATNL